MTTQSVTTAPAWHEPDSPPRWLRLTDGRLVATWERILSAAAWIARWDDIDQSSGRIRPGETTISIDAGHTVVNLDAAGARRLAVELLAAAGDG